MAPHRPARSAPRPRIALGAQLPGTHRRRRRLCASPGAEGAPRECSPAARPLAAGALALATHVACEAHAAPRPAALARGRVVVVAAAWSVEPLVRLPRLRSRLCVLSRPRADEHAVLAPRLWHTHLLAPAGRQWLRWRLGLPLRARSATTRARGGGGRPLASGRLLAAPRTPPAPPLLPPRAPVAARWLGDAPPPCGACLPSSAGHRPGLQKEEVVLAHAPAALRAEASLGEPELGWAGVLGLWCTRREGVREDGRVGGRAGDSDHPTASPREPSPGWRGMWAEKVSQGGAGWGRGAAQGHDWGNHRQSAGPHDHSAAHPAPGALAPFGEINRIRPGRWGWLTSTKNSSVGPHEMEPGVLR